IGDQHRRAAKRQNGSANQRIETAQLDQRPGDRDQQQQGERQPGIAEEHADQLGGDFLQQGHRATSIAVPRAIAVPASPAPRKIATNSSSARSCPGRPSPSPSPVQNTPNADSMTPTPNFRVFSGTRDSGR